VGLKRLGQAARGVQRGIRGVEQLQIAQLGLAVKEALRKDIAAHHHNIRWTSRLQSKKLLDFALKWLATNGEWLERWKVQVQSNESIICHNTLKLTYNYDIREYTLVTYTLLISFDLGQVRAL
jgi:hypothetical protein